VPGQPIPDVIVPVPNGKKIVTATPKNIVPCEPTQADVALTISTQTPDAWLEVTRTRVLFTSKPDLPPTIHPNQGQEFGERLSRLNLIAPGTATLYAATFMYSGDQIAIDMVLTPKAQSLMLLQFWVKHLAEEMDLQPPTPEQTLAISEGLATVPGFQAAIGRFTSIAVPASGNGSLLDPLRLLPKLDQAASQAATDIHSAGSGTQLEALRALLEDNLVGAVSSGPLKQALESLATPSVLLGPLRAQLLLLLPSVNEPVSITFLSGRSQPVSTVAAIQSLSSSCDR
jgi:hypothetical protein